MAKTTLDRVLEAVRELNYRPNDIARSLRGQRTHTVGLITPTLTNPVYAEVAMGITDVLGDESYLLMVCDAEDSPDHDTQYAHMLVSKQVDAVVLIPTADAADTLAILADGCVPVVVIEQNADPTPSVVFDAERTGQLATEHLIELGRTRIAIIRERRSGRDSWRRFAGYKKASKRRASMSTTSSWLVVTKGSQPESTPQNVSSI